MFHLVATYSSFILFAIIGSLFCCGWYTITRGEVYAYDENDKPLTRGKIFKFWSLFWERKHRVNGEDGDYVFPMWVHLPLSSCVTCFSSIYGSLIYWGAGSLFVALSDVKLAPVWALFGLWVVYCICVAALNNIIIKKVL